MKGSKWKLKSHKVKRTVKCNKVVESRQSGEIASDSMDVDCRLFFIQFLLYCWLHRKQKWVRSMQFVMLLFLMLLLMVQEATDKVRRNEEFISTSAAYKSKWYIYRWKIICTKLRKKESYKWNKYIETSKRDAKRQWQVHTWRCSQKLAVPKEKQKSFLVWKLIEKETANYRWQQKRSKDGIIKEHKGSWFDCIDGNIVNFVLCNITNDMK